MKKKIIQIRHPAYDLCYQDWKKYRSAYNGGRDFIESYLVQYTKREDATDFTERKKITYNAAFAAVAIDEVRNSLIQRLSDVKRITEDKIYAECILGKNGGVDQRGSSMNNFLGNQVLPDLLVMKKVGIYVDMPPLQGPTLAENYNIHPYLYTYPAEDILSWRVSYLDGRTYVTNVLLREYIYSYNSENGLPEDTIVRFRHVWWDGEKVLIQFYNSTGDKVDIDGQPSITPVILPLNRIPFVCPEINRSLMEYIADYQIALLNVNSSDLGYLLKANFPFYVEQFDGRAEALYLRTTSDETGESGDANIARTREGKVGPTSGRRYPMQAEQPAFIHPSSEPLLAAMKKEEQMKAEIRALLNLTITNLDPKMASAESKSFDVRSLESGLSAIGLELQFAEQQIVEIWQQYQGKKYDTLISYPEKYDLRTEDAKREDAKDLTELKNAVPSRIFKKEIDKKIVTVLLKDQVTTEKLTAIYKEIESSIWDISDYKAVQADVEMGLVSLVTASNARGYVGEKEVPKAKEEHKDRLERIAQAQGMKNPDARGIKDLSADASGAKEEKKEAKDTTQDDNPGDKTRGDGK